MLYTSKQPANTHTHALLHSQKYRHFFSYIPLNVYTYVLSYAYRCVFCRDSCYNTEFGSLLFWITNRVNFCHDNDTQTHIFAFTPSVYVYLCVCVFVCFWYADILNLHLYYIVNGNHFPFLASNLYQTHTHALIPAPALTPYFISFSTTTTTATTTIRSNCKL